MTHVNTRSVAIGLMLATALPVALAATPANFSFCLFGVAVGGEGTAVPVSFSGSVSDHDGDGVYVGSVDLVSLAPGLDARYAVRAAVTEGFPTRIALSSGSPSDDEGIFVDLLADEQGILYAGTGFALGHGDLALAGPL